MITCKKGLKGKMGVDYGLSLLWAVAVQQAGVSLNWGLPSPVVAISIGRVLSWGCC
jgi:hypothetical protein